MISFRVEKIMSPTFLGRQHWPFKSTCTRLVLAWKYLEANTFELGEFELWMKMVHADTMMEAKLETRGVLDACNLLDYCIHLTESKYSVFRRCHEVKDLYHIKPWGMSNEIDRTWQLGKNTMDELWLFIRRSVEKA